MKTKNCHLFQDDSIINSEDKSIYRLWNILAVNNQWILAYF